MIQIKKIFTTIPIILLLLFVSGCTIVKASEPSFSLYPAGGTVLNKDNGFIVDVLIDSGGEELTSAQFTLLFDPESLQLTKAERNNSLFSQYPEDESTIDNDNGVVMLTGFTQSGSADLYMTGEKSDIFARLTFEILQEGETTLEWKYGGSNATFDTVMYTDGSPPQNILTTKPEDATFTIGEDIVIDTSAIDTGIPLDKYILATGIVLILFGTFMVFTRPGNTRKKKGTVVVYDE